MRRLLSEPALATLVLLFSLALYAGMALCRSASMERERFDTWGWHPHGVSRFMAPLSHYSDRRA